MKEYLIIDGYNIISAWSELKEIKEESLDHARERLIEIITNHQALTGAETIIIFDAYQVKGGLEKRERFGNVDVIYTKEGMTADMAIERLVAQIPKHQKVFVATSDRLQQETIWGKGALRISARELYREVQMAKKDNKKFIEPKLYTANRLEDRISPEVKALLEKMRFGDGMEK